MVFVVVVGYWHAHCYWNKEFSFCRKL